MPEYIPYLLGQLSSDSKLLTILKYKLDYHKNQNQKHSATMQAETDFVTKGF